MNQEVMPLSREDRPVIYGEVLFDTFPDSTSVMGGAPFNVAWHLQGFGLKPLLISRIGRDEQGNKVLQIMHDWGLDTQGLQIDDLHPTGAVMVSLDDGQPTFNIVPDQAYDFIEPQVVQEIVERTPVSLLYHGSLVARSHTSLDTLMTLRTITKKPVFVDINLRSPWWDHDIVDELVKHASWLKLNDDELIKLATDDNASQQLPDAARTIFDRYQLQLLIVTRGGEGAFIMNKDGRTDGYPVTVEQIADTVGAGDAFSAVTVLGLLYGWALEDILQRALQFASMICAVRGATIQDKDLYRTLLQQWQKSDD